MVSVEAVSDREFLDFSKMFYQRSGINLDTEKKYLVVHRLQKLLTEEDQIDTFSDLSQILKEGTDQRLITRFVDVLTTNYSYFFRDPIHFRFLQYYFKYKAKEKKRVRIWSAACSSGEEPYSIALTMKEYLPDIANGDFKVYASDISQSMLKKAEDGSYRRDGLNRYLNESTMREYFVDGDNPNECRVSPELKKLVSFQQVNLLEQFPFRDDFDLVFLRNVLIYFDAEKKERILANIAPYLRSNGYLILSLSESLLGTKHPFKHVKHSIYSH